jgi:hypothetical protein
VLVFNILTCMCSRCAGGCSNGSSMTAFSGFGGSGGSSCISIGGNSSSSRSSSDSLECDSASRQAGHVLASHHSCGVPMQQQPRPLLLAHQQELSGDIGMVAGAAPQAAPVAFGDVFSAAGPTPKAAAARSSLCSEPYLPLQQPMAQQQQQRQCVGAEARMTDCCSSNTTKVGSSFDVPCV